MSNKIRTVIVDDHRHFRVGIKTELEADNGISVVAEGHRGEHVKQLLLLHHPDVLVLDLRMKQYEDPTKGDEDFSALPTIFDIHQAYPNLAIVILSGYINPTIIEDAFSKGVRGYILKDEAEDLVLSRVVRFAHQGRLIISNSIQEMLVNASSGVANRPKLTPRQIEIVKAVNTNLNASDAIHAAKLGISESGLRNRLSKIYQTMNVQTKTSCIVECMRYGYIPFEPLFYST